jgi:hypothetical protein
MMNDPRLYKDPERFMPERFLGENPERDPRELAFGFGRRYRIYVQIFTPFFTTTTENVQVSCSLMTRCS